MERPHEPPVLAEERVEVRGLAHGVVEEYLGQAARAQSAGAQSAGAPGRGCGVQGDTCQLVWGAR